MDRALYYNRHLRDPAAKKFYNSKIWINCRTNYIREHPFCERCQRVVADHVHHVIPLDQCTDAQKIDPANLKSVCISCHNIIEAQTQTPAPVTLIGTLTLVEDAEFYFDEAAADAPCRFISKFCRHFEGRFAGQPFTLLPWQRQLIRTLFGWKYRTTHLRRFRELYLITAKGAGKTPLLAAIALYMLIGDGEAGAHVVSMASSFEQANLTFDAGKKYIAESAELSRHKGIVPKQYIIEAPRYSKWTTVSGKPNGRSGPRPSCILASELHEWPAVTVKAFDMLCANLFKRSQPLLLIDTNAAADRQGYAWQLHERAAGVLAGSVDDKSLLPFIFEAPKELDWRSEEAARAANPSIPDVVTFDQIKPEQSKGEARYRRLYLSQWVTGSDKWLDLDKWDECVKTLDADAIKDIPRYVGVDLSGGDDLCAMVDCYVASAMLYVDSRFWLPRITAERYQQKDLITYSEWADEKAITLLDEQTISIAVQQRIAQTIIDSHIIHPITAVCYDRAYAGGVIPLVQAAGITCIKIGQGWGVSEGCKELDNRLIEKSISVAPNNVMRFCAQNVEVTTDDRGNYWPIKPHAKGKSMGRRAMKIDGISALVTALTMARQHAFAKPIAYVGADAFDLD